MDYVWAGAYIEVPTLYMKPGLMVFHGISEEASRDNRERIIECQKAQKKHGLWSEHWYWGRPRPV
jgi:hypothetical protein